MIVDLPAQPPCGALCSVPWGDRIAGYVTIALVIAIIAVVVPILQPSRQLLNLALLLLHLCREVAVKPQP